MKMLSLILLSLLLSSCTRVDDSQSRPSSSSELTPDISPYKIIVDGEYRTPTILKVKDGCTAIYLIGARRNFEGYDVGPETGYVVSDIDCYRGIDR